MLKKFEIQNYIRLFYHSGSKYCIKVKGTYLQVICQFLNL